MLVDRWRAPAADPAPKRFAGVDLSYVNEIEACGAQFRLNGKLRDPYELFAESGANLVRLRLWNNPTWTNYSTEADVTRSIERAKKAGMHVLLDFHYSDDWADPQKQTIPAAWAADIGDADKLATHVYEYTRDVLARLNARGLLPYMVQVGNEINTQMLRPADTKGLPIDWARNAKILNAGIRAVREAKAADGASPKVMLHVAQPENVEPWFAAATAAGVRDFDYIGVSYYPKWSTFNMKQAGAALAAVKQRFKADIIVVEVSYPWTLRDAGDKASNLLGEDSLLRGYPATPSGQQRFMNDVVRMTLEAGGVGVVYWEPAWVSTKCATRWGTGSHWENATLFDFRKGNELTPAADFLKAIRRTSNCEDMEKHAAEGWTVRHRQDRARSTHSFAAARIRASSSRPARAATRRWTACRTFRTSRAMLAAVPDLHCISICTPPQAHFDAALTALRAGKHVMLEKPPAATTRQIALARRRSRAPRPHSVPDLAFALRRGRRRCARIPAHAQTGERQDHLEGRCAPVASGPALDLGAGRFRRVRSGHQRVVAAHRNPAQGSLRRRRTARVSGKSAVAHRGESSHCAPKTASRSAPNSISARRANRAGTSSLRRPPARSSSRAVAPSSPSTARR